MNNKILIKISGKNPNYLLKEIIKKKINIYNLDKTNNYILILIDYNDYKIIKKIKTTYKITIIKRYGLIRINELIKKNIITIICIIIGITINIILSKIIFEIKIDSPNKKIVKIIKNDLNNTKIKKYRFKVSFKEKEQIKKYILNKEKNNIEWLEIEEKGNKYIIKVEERKLNKKEEKCNYRHIISKKNAIITKINSSSGEIIKKINDYVSKGDILISGFIYNKDKIVSKRCSLGSVYGETWYRMYISVPKKEEKIKITNNKKYLLDIKFLNKEHIINNKYKTFIKNEYNIIESKIIPIKIGISKLIETKEIVNNYNINNIDKYILSISDKELKKRIGKDKKILNKKILKKSENNSKIKVEVFFQVEEEITDYLDITEINIDEMNKKEEE